MTSMLPLIFFAGVLAVVAYMIVATVGLVIWPKSVTKQKWFLPNEDQLRRLPWVARVGQDPDTMTPAAQRFRGGLILVFFLLLILSRVPGTVAKTLTLTGLEIIILAGFVKMLAWVVLPSAVLEARPWITSGFPKIERRAIWLRIFGVLGAIISGIVAYLVALRFGP